MATALSFQVHKLTARLDRAADVLLRAEEGLSYARFLVLLAVGEGNTSQRELSRWLGQSEPSTSRMVAVLAEAGLLEAANSPGAGNRRHVTLTHDGRGILDRGSVLLETRFQQLLRDSGVPYRDYERHTTKLLSQLELDFGSAERAAG